MLVWTASPIAMILLTAFVMQAAILVSWKVETMGKEFFVLLLLLSAGAYGFFLSLDLFTLFFFLEISVIPKFLLIGVWGSGKKEYSGHETGADADGRVGIGVYRVVGIIL
jgi:NADH-quinone oxidoreductase subunit M